MRKFLIPVLAACALAGAAPAGAAPTAQVGLMLDLAVDDGCALVAVENESLVGGSPDTWIGVLVLAAPDHPAGPWCEVRVSGLQRYRLDPQVRLAGLAVGAIQVVFDAADTQSVVVCSHNTPSAGCDVPSRSLVPPQEVYDLVNPFLLGIDAVLCPILGMLAPGVPGVLDIDSDGDLSLVGGRIWDCPPYGD